MTGEALIAAAVEIYLRAITRFDLSRGAPHGRYVRKDYREEIMNYAIRT